MSEKKDDLWAKVKKEMAPKNFQPIKTEHVAAKVHAQGQIENKAELSDKEIVENLAKYMMHYDAKLGYLSEEKLKDAEEAKVYKGKAINLINSIAQEQGKTANEIYTMASQDGISLLTDAYHRSQMFSQIGNKRKAVLHDLVDWTDHKALENIVNGLKGSNETYAEIAQGELLVNAKHYVEEHFTNVYSQYHAKAEAKAAKKHH